MAMVDPQDARAERDREETQERNERKREREKDTERERRGSMSGTRKIRDHLYNFFASAICIKQEEN
jgi:hypothetical protein